LEFVNLVSRPAAWQGGYSGHLMFVVGTVHVFCPALIMERHPNPSIGNCPADSRHFDSILRGM